MKISPRVFLSVYSPVQGCTINQAIEQYLHVVLFITLCKVNFKSVNKTLVCDHSNESFRALVWYCGTVVMLFQKPDETFFKLLFCFLTCRDHLFDHLAWTMKLFGCPIISCVVCNRYDHCATSNPLTHPSGSPSNGTLLALLKSTNAISETEDGKLKSQSKQLRRQISPKYHFSASDF